MIQLHREHFAAFDGEGVWPYKIYNLALSCIRNPEYRYPWEYHFLELFGHSADNPRSQIKDLLRS